ncbi:TPA: hypothetical protein ACN5P3_004082 [Citrobacter freundii]|uniref:hypothetical protein n=1 Tax=Citrobacter braakii TaxID=57706 RepID=UPI003B7A715E
MKRVFMGALAVALVGCESTPPEDKNFGGFVYIYSTTSKAIAQDRADQMCGGHAYYIYNEHLHASEYGPRYPAIKYNCDLDMAASEGSQEAREIKKKRLEEAYSKLIGAHYELKESRRQNADPNKLESYTERYPDGTTLSYSFYKGKSCETITYTDGTGTTTCD